MELIEEKQSCAVTSATIKLERNSKINKFSKSATE